MGTNKVCDEIRWRNLFVRSLPGFSISKDNKLDLFAKNYDSLARSM